MLLSYVSLGVTESERVLKASCLSVFFCIEVFEKNSAFVGFLREVLKVEMGVDLKYTVVQRILGDSFH